MLWPSHDSLCNQLETGGCWSKSTIILVWSTKINYSKFDSGCLAPDWVVFLLSVILLYMGILRRITSSVSGRSLIVNKPTNWQYVNHVRSSWGVVSITSVTTFSSARSFHIYARLCNDLPDDFWAWGNGWFLVTVGQLCVRHAWCESLPSLWAISWCFLAIEREGHYQHNFMHVWIKYRLCDKTCKDPGSENRYTSLCWLQYEFCWSHDRRGAARVDEDCWRDHACTQIFGSKLKYGIFNISLSMVARNN